MNKRHFRCSVLLIAILLVCASNICGASRVGTKERRVLENATHFPEGTVLVARSRDGTLLWAEIGKLHNSRTGTDYVFPNKEFVCERIVWSADQRRVLVIGETDAYILNATSLRLVRHLETFIAWWQGSNYAYLNYRSEPYRIVSQSGKTIYVPKNLEIYSADPENGDLLCGRLLPREWNWQERDPALRMQIWKQNTQGKLHRMRILGKAYFDGGSTGVPRAFGTTTGRRVVMGAPHGGGTFETLQMADRGEINALFSANSKEPLRNQHGPFNAGTILFGMLRPEPGVGAPIKAPFLYRVSDSKVTLKKLGMYTAFVYYDPVRDAIGIATSTNTDVVVRFTPVKPH